MELLIKKVTEEDYGNFYCHAENVFGGMTKLVTLTKQKVMSYSPEFLEVSAGRLHMRRYFFIIANKYQYLILWHYQW